MTDERPVSASVRRLLGRQPGVGYAAGALSRLRPHVSGPCRREQTVSDRLHVRPIQADDRDRLTAAFAYTSPATYYRRYHTPKQRYTTAELDFLTRVDGHDHLALVATDPQQDHRLAAVARYVRDPDPDSAELAITVHDPYQRAGVGRMLLTALAAEAHLRGIRTLRAEVQGDNHAMVRLIRRVFPQAQMRARHGTVAEWVCPLPAVGV